MTQLALAALFGVRNPTSSSARNRASWWFPWLAAVVGLWLASPAVAGAVKVGLAVPSSADQADEADMVEKAVRWHADAINASGRLGEHTLEIVVADSAGDAASTLQSSGAAAVVGYLDDASAVAAAPAYQSAGIPLLVPTAEDPRLVRTGDKIFSMSYDGVEQGKRIAAFLRVVEKAERIAVIHGDDPPSLDMLRALTKNVGKDMEVVTTVSLPGGTADEKLLLEAFPMLARKGDGKARPGKGDRGEKGSREKGRKGKGGKGAKAKSGDPRDGGGGREDRAVDEESFDALVVITDAAEGAKIVNTFRRAKVDMPILGTSSWADDAFLGTLKSSKRVYLTSPLSWSIVSVDGKAVMDFLGGKSVAALFARDAVELIAASVAEGHLDATAIAADLASRQSPDRAVVGASGLLYFDKNGSLAREPIFQAVVKGELKPHFTQLTRVTDPRTARDALRGKDSKFIGDRKLAVVDGVPYYLTSVVYAGLDFYRVNSVDVAGQNFDVEFYMWFQWMGDVDVENIDFLNGIYGIEDKVEVLRQDLDSPVRYICYKIKGTYLTPYDLRAFPFDVQRLPMRMAHKTRDANEVLLVVDGDNLDHSHIEEIYPEEWTHLGRTDWSASYEPQSNFGDPMFSGPASRSMYSVYETNIVIERILFPYLVTLFMPLGIMIVISLFVFMVPRKQFDARMTITMTALLSILVFHLAQGETLPSVGYLMRADQFFMATYLLMFALIAKTIVVNALDEKVDDKKLVWAERIFTALFVPVCLGTYAVLLMRPTA